MDKAIEKLLNSRSVVQLGIPYNQTELATIYQSALNAPDHRGLQPWRFITIGQEQKNGLLRCYIHAQKGEGQSPDDAARKSLAAKLNCSPNIVICIFSPKKHIKVPESEQLLSMGAAIQNMIVTSCLLGGSAFWATGDLAYTQGFKDILGLEQQERIVGILHLGKSPHKTIPKERPNVDLFFKRLEA